jgi:hypothetical protein
MNYRIQRGDQEFGPYSLADLQRYLQSGHVLASDLAQSEGMSEWTPVSQILGDIPIPLAPQPGIYAGTDPYAEPAQQIVDLPPNMHWGWLLLLEIVTRSLFTWIWGFVLANWARRLSGKNTALVLFAMYPAAMITGIVVMALGKTDSDGIFGIVGVLVILAAAICRLIGAFKIREAMEEYYNSVENIGLSLGPVMTFFFGVLYIQYHVNRIARWKKTGVLS